MSGFLFPQNTDLKRREKQGVQPKITEQIDSQLDENIDMNPNMKFGKSEIEKMYIESKDENYPEDLERRLPNQEGKKERFLSFLSTIKSLVFESYCIKTNLQTITKNN